MPPLLSPIRATTPPLLSLFRTATPLLLSPIRTAARASTEEEEMGIGEEKEPREERSRRRPRLDARSQLRPKPAPPEFLRTSCGGRKRKREEQSRGPRPMWRRLATAALSLGANTEDPVATLKVCAYLPPRLLRDSVTAATVAVDYRWSLWGLEPGTSTWQSAKHDAHLRSANRLQELCFRNGGIYIKLGQHIAQLEYVVPEDEGIDAEEVPGLLLRGGPWGVCQGSQ